MVDKLFTIGDSWTYGWDLPGRHIPRRNKEHAWPTLLAHEFKCKLINEAWGGGSNDWMFRKTIEWVCSQDNLDDVIVIVGWVEPNRREESSIISDSTYGFISPHDTAQYKPFMEYHLILLNKIY